MNYYSTQNVCALFQVSHQTVKNWSDEFASFLSPSATPGANRKRSFTPHDLQVFSLVNDFRKRGFTYADAQAALAAGQIGDIPESTTDLVASPPPALLLTLREEITNLRLILKSVESERDKERGKVELLEKQLEAKEDLIRKMYQENAELRVKGKDTN